MRIMAYTCQSCGGTLRVDRALRVYRCDYCGVTFDYDYFLEEGVLDRAYSYLRDKEFTAAAEAFEFILQKEPYNAQAHRGLILATAEVTDINGFSDRDAFMDFQYTRLEEVLERAVANVSEEERPFFESLSEMITEGKSYREARSLAEKNETIIKEIERKADNCDRQADSAIKGRDETALAVFLVLITILFFGMIFALSTVNQEYTCYLTKTEAASFSESKSVYCRPASYSYIKAHMERPSISYGYDKDATSAGIIRYTTMHFKIENRELYSVCIVLGYVAIIVALSQVRKAIRKGSEKVPGICKLRDKATELRNSLDDEKAALTQYTSKANAHLNDIRKIMIVVKRSDIAV